MRRFLFTLVAGVALVALGPASAIARSHHRSHHGSRNRHALIRHERFGDVSGSSSSTAPTQGETAGKISAFSQAADGMTGILTIRLNDGTMVSGEVNGTTQLECEMAQPNATFHTDDGNGDQGPNGGNGDQGNGDENGDQGDDQGENENAQTCTMNSLAVGTVVSEAELRISSAGAIWDKVRLVG